MSKKPKATWICLNCKRTWLSAILIPCSFCHLGDVRKLSPIEFPFSGLKVVKKDKTEVSTESLGVVKKETQ